MPGKEWSRGDIIGVVGILIAIVAVVAAILVPEARQWLGLEKRPNTAPITVEAAVNPTPDAVKNTNSQGAPSNVVSNANAAGNSSRPSVPKFTGEVGQLEDGNKFADFIYANENKIVFLDIYMRDDAFDGDVDGPDYFFVIFSECDGLLANEKPSITKCVGTEFNINNSGKATDYGFYYSRGVYKLHGYFAITGVDGPYQGLMGVGMKPLNYESIAPGIMK